MSNLLSLLFKKRATGANSTCCSLQKSDVSEWFVFFVCFSLLFPFLGPRANRSRRSRSVTFFHLSSLYTKEGPWGICSFSRANCSFALKIASNSLEKPKSEFPALLKTFTNLRQFPCLFLFSVQVFFFVMSNCLGQLYYASPPVSGGLLQAILQA